MDIEDILTPGAVVAKLRATSKKQALQELARVAADVTGEDERAIFEVLLERERLGSTGVGGGVAIPHGKLAGLDRLQGVFARLAQPIDFDAVDDRPVDLMFVLLAPEGAGADHLKALAQVSRLLRDPATCDKMRGSDSRDAVYALLTQGGGTGAHDTPPVRAATS
ncbi:MAG: PTS IIA-like nitrogen regulatory protein PtsN [Alphaproteobacteria bacterium]|nr:PTS IIA-like nitrogen regulatory protein PtsN [Alphaproteobacteria bacterium]